MNREKDTAGDIVTVANFIAFQNDGEICGGYKKEEAFSALCRLVGIDQKTLREICMQDFPVDA